MILFIIPLSGAQILFNEQLIVNDNIFSDYTKVNDVINQFTLNIADNSIRKDSVFWWSLQGGAEHYFSNDTESNYLFSGFFKKRMKFSSSVFDLSGKAVYNLYPVLTKGNVIDNASYTQLLLQGNMHYRYDLDAASFHVYYSFTSASFPDYTLDNIGHSVTLHISFDPSLFTTIDFKSIYTVNNFSERYVMDGSGIATDEAFYENRLLFSLGIKHFFNPGFSIRVSAFYEDLAANGNFYFFGPNETVLILDLDELLINDFYSYSMYGLRLKLMKNINKLKVEMNLSYGKRSYSGRLPFDASDMYIAGSLEKENVLAAALKLILHMGESSRLFLYGKYEDTDSNNYKADAATMTVSGGIQFWL